MGHYCNATRLTHVAFADDCTLIARSWTSLKRMVLQLLEALWKRGLSLHPTNCKIQTNIDTWESRGDVMLEDGFSVEVLAVGEPLQVLGTALAFQDSTQHEILSRVSAGWRSFWSLKTLLMNQRTSVKRRMKLFDSTVASCVLWCAQSWALRQEEVRILRSTRRAMLRRIAGVRRAPDEDYVDWIKRGTQKAEAIAASSRVREWTKAHYSMKWSWAGHVARRPTDSWIWRTTSWRDSEWQGLLDESTSCTRPLRPSRRRWTRWEDGLRRFCAAEGLGKWQALAQNRELWSTFTFKP